MQLAYNIGRLRSGIWGTSGKHIYIVLNISISISIRIHVRVHANNRTILIAIVVRCYIGMSGGWDT